MSFVSGDRGALRIQIDSVAFESGSPGRVEKVAVTASDIEQGMGLRNEASNPADDSKAVRGVVRIRHGLGMMAAIVERS